MSNESKILDELMKIDKNTTDTNLNISYMSNTIGQLKQSLKNDITKSENNSARCVVNLLTNLFPDNAFNIAAAAMQTYNECGINLDITYQGNPVSTSFQPILRNIVELQNPPNQLISATPIAPNNQPQHSFYTQNQHQFSQLAPQYPTQQQHM